MSSILKALKKLEKETLEQQDEPRLSMGLNIRSEKNRRQEKSRGLNKRSIPWVWTALLLLVFLGAGTFITLVSNDNDNPPQTQMPPPRGEEPQEIAQTRPAPGETQQSKTPMDHAAPPEPRESTPPAIAKALPPAIAEEPPEPPLDATHENKSNKIKKLNEIDAIHNTDKIHAVNEIQEPNEIPLLSDNSLIINAIAWSNDPTKRLAVINSAIVRQGQTIGGFLVVDIEENQVIVQQSDKKWRVMFRLR